MFFWQVIAAIKGFDERMKLQAAIYDKIAIKVINGTQWAKPKNIPFEKLFPAWAETKQEQRPLTQEEIMQRSVRRLDAWADIIEY